MLAPVSLPSVPEPVSAEERLRVLQELEATLAGLELEGSPATLEAAAALRALLSVPSPLAASTLAAAVITFHVHLELGLRDVASSLGRTARRRAMRRADEVAKHVEYLRTQLAELPAVSH